MIQFFRRIRLEILKKNNTGKYVKYAIGEIVLVVIGILIALSINNWNEGRKDLITEQNYLKRLLADLKGDYETLTFSEGLTKSRIDQIYTLQAIINPSPAQAPENPETVIVSIEKVTWRSYLPLSKIVFNELLSTGKMSVIRSEQLRSLLSSYYEDADHWEMILNLEDAQKEFSHATAGLLSTDMLKSIENSSALRNSYPDQQFEINIEPHEFSRIVSDFSSNTEAQKWLPQIYHYHVLAEKVIKGLLQQNTELRKLVEHELN